MLWLKVLWTTATQLFQSHSTKQLKLKTRWSKLLCRITIHHVFSSITNLMNLLHWLPVSFSCSRLPFNCQISLPSFYLKAYLHPEVFYDRHLRRSSTDLVFLETSTYSPKLYISIQSFLIVWIFCTEIIEFSSCVRTDKSTESVWSKFKS